MKTSGTLLWGALLLTAGAFVSCEGSRSNQDNTSTTGTPQRPVVTVNEEELSSDSLALLPKKPFNPRAGRGPQNREEYKAALKSIEQYKEFNPRSIVTSNYFSDSLIRALIGKEGSATDKKVSGLRVYRTYTPGEQGFGVLVVAVDEKGKEIKNKAQLKDGSQVDYTFGISQERCPHNCGSFEQEQ